MLCCEYKDYNQRVTMNKSTMFVILSCAMFGVQKNQAANNYDVRSSIYHHRDVATKV